MVRVFWLVHDLTSYTLKTSAFKSLKNEPTLFTNSVMRITISGNSVYFDITDSIFLPTVRNFAIISGMLTTELNSLSKIADGEVFLKRWMTDLKASTTRRKVFATSGITLAKASACCAASSNPNS